MVPSEKIMTVAAFILAGGRGDRVHGPIPKIELLIAGLPCFQHLLNTAKSLESVTPFVVASPHFARHNIHHAIQEHPRGTGDAVHVACKAWGATPPETVLVLYADVPLIRAETLRQTLKHHKAAHNTITLLSFDARLPNTYGRILEDPKEKGRVISIIDASDEERPVFGNTLAHSGIMLIKGSFLWENIQKITPKNAQKEFYLTDIVGVAADAGHRVGHTTVVKEEAQGLNTWSDWVILENIFQTRARSWWFTQNTLVGAYVNLHHDTHLEPGVIIDPFVTFGPKVTIRKNTHIRSFTHLSHCTIDEGSAIGPFTHIHKNTSIGAGNTIGNFVECVRSTTHENIKAKHLAYLGDTTLHAKTNIGAGTVFANFDGHTKHSSTVEEGAFIGANAVIIGPNTIGKNSFIAAGSTITHPVPRDNMAVARAPQKNKTPAQRYRPKRSS